MSRPQRRTGANRHHKASTKTHTAVIADNKEKEKLLAMGYDAAMAQAKNREERRAIEALFRKDK